MVTHQKVKMISIKIDRGYVNYRVRISSFLNITTNIAWLCFELAKKWPFRCNMKNIFSAKLSAFFLKKQRYVPVPRAAFKIWASKSCVDMPFCSSSKKTFVTT